MRRALYGMLAVVALLASACGGGKTTSNCDPACTIWKNCGAWDYSACMSDCQTAGDWGQSYLDCLKGTSCTSLNSCG